MIFVHYTKVYILMSKVNECLESRLTWRRPMVHEPSSVHASDRIFKNAPNFTRGWNRTQILKLNGNKAQVEDDLK
jgi:hypothetical protein